MKARIKKIAKVLQAHPEWDAFSEPEVISAGMKKVAGRKEEVPLNELLAYILLSSRWRELRKLAETSGEGGKLAEAALEMFRNPRLSALRLDGEAEQQMLQGLVAYGVIDVDHVNDITAMGDTETTVWELEGVGLPVMEREIYDARRLLGYEWPLDKPGGKG